MALPVTTDKKLLYVPDGEVLEEYFWDRSKLSIIQGPIGCLSADTEFLTPYGWKRMDAFEEGDRVFVWKDGKAWFEHPLAYIDKPCEEMWSFRNAHSLSMVLSDEHRVALYDREGRFRVREAADVAAAPGRYTLPTGFEVGGAPFDEWELRLRVAIAADGCLPKRGNQVVITVRKDRKKDRLRQLLFKAQIAHKEYEHSTRAGELTFAFERRDWMSKTLDLIGCGSARAEVVIDEMSHWDGLWEGDDIRFDGTCKATAEFMQYAAHATGRRATITTKIDKRNPDWKPVYSVSISHKDSPKSKVGIRADGISIERVPTPDGRKYCFTTSTGFFVARHDGRIFVTGNSGTSSASCMRIWAQAMEQEPDLDGVRRSRWIITRDTYKELRETTVKTWLQWFPEDMWGPFIRSEPMVHQLIDAKGGGLRKHPSGDGTLIECEVIFLAIPDADIAEAVCASYEITGFFRNEGQFCDKAVTDELLSRCGRYPSKMKGPGATWFGGMIDMNAPVEGHWVPWMRGDIPLPAEMSDEEREVYVKPKDWRFYVQPPGLIEKIVDGKPQYSFNPLAENQNNLVESYLEKIQGKPKSWIDRRVLNKVGMHVDGQPVYPTFEEADHVSPEDVEPREGLPIVVGLDFGRMPAAIFMQEFGGTWFALSELIGHAESAQLFAPKVKKHLARWYPGFRVEFWGDPRGGDGTQATEDTAFDVYMAHGMKVIPATSDNDVELRRSTVEMVLEKRGGLRVNPRCTVLKRGLAGGYHFPKIKGRPGLYAPKPLKNLYSHAVEAFENGLLGGGEGYQLVANKSVERARPIRNKRQRIKLRRSA